MVRRLCRLAVAFSVASMVALISTPHPPFEAATTTTTVTTRNTPSSKASSVVDPLSGKKKNATSSSLPNVLLIGAQKAGSTALAEWLHGSGGVCLGLRRNHCFDNCEKEMHFFDNHKLYYQKGPELYARSFRHCPRGSLAMDATPATIRYPDRVYETYRRTDPGLLKTVKIIVSLREPIGRELSLYNYMASLYRDRKDPDKWYSKVASTNGTVKTFAEFVETYTLPGLQQQGSTSSVAHYARYLRRWFELFDPQQILVLSYEHDVREGTPAKERLREFLGLRGDAEGPEGPFPTANQQSGPFKTKTIDCATRDRLQAVLEPFHQELYRLLADHHRPSMERQPFPRFGVFDCVGVATDTATSSSA